MCSDLFYREMIHFGGIEKTVFVYLSVYVCVCIVHEDGNHLQSTTLEQIVILSLTQSCQKKNPTYNNKIKNAARRNKKTWIWHDAGFDLLSGAEENGHL